MNRGEVVRDCSGIISEQPEDEARKRGHGLVLLDETADEIGGNHDGEMGHLFLFFIIYDRSVVVERRSAAGVQGD